MFLLAIIITIPSTDILSPEIKTSPFSTSVEISLTQPINSLQVEWYYIVVESTNNPDRPPASDTYIDLNTTSTSVEIFGLSMNTTYNLTVTAHKFGASITSTTMFTTSIDDVSNNIAIATAVLLTVVILGAIAILIISGVR